MLCWNQVYIPTLNFLKTLPPKAPWSNKPTPNKLPQPSPSLSVLLYLAWPWSRCSSDLLKSRSKRLVVFGSDSGQWEEVEGEVWQRLPSGRSEIKMDSKSGWCSGEEMWPSISLGQQPERCTGARGPPYKLSLLFWSRAYKLNPAGIRPRP